MINRKDKTTQFRGPKETWDPILVEEITKDLHNAMSKMWSNYKK